MAVRVRATQQLQVHKKSITHMSHVCSHSSDSTPLPSLSPERAHPKHPLLSFPFLSSLVLCSTNLAPNSTASKLSVSPQVAYSKKTAIFASPTNNQNRHLGRASQKRSEQLDHGVGGAIVAALAICCLLLSRCALGNPHSHLTSSRFGYPHHAARQRWQFWGVGIKLGLLGGNASSVFWDGFFFMQLPFSDEMVNWVFAMVLTLIFARNWVGFFMVWLV
jgi:hypothetical protein